jgi:uncharacterized protein (DUF2062 family)
VRGFQAGIHVYSPLKPVFGSLPDLLYDGIGMVPFGILLHPFRAIMNFNSARPFVAYLKKSRLWTKLKDQILHPDITPEQIAKSFGLGLSIAFNPVLGLHTGVAIALCVLFRTLHRPLLFASVMVNNPWTMVPIATVSAYLGNILMGRGLALDLSRIHWEGIGWSSFATRHGLGAMFHMLKPILAPYLLGGFLLSALAFPLGYFAMLKLSKHLRKLHLHLPHLHLPTFHRDPITKENPHGHALPHETGPGHAAETDGRSAEPPRGGDGRG